MLKLDFLDKFNQLDAQVSAKFHKETPTGKKLSWGKVIGLIILLLIVSSIISLIANPVIIESSSYTSLQLPTDDDIVTNQEPYVADVTGDIFDYPASYTLNNLYTVGQMVNNADVSGGFAIASDPYNVEPQSFRDSCIADEGGNPIERQAGGITFYAVEYVDDGEVTELGFFEFNGSTYGYTIIGNVPEDDLYIMLSNIHF